MPDLLPDLRWALTPPFHPYPGRIRGGLLSVALSRSFRRAGITCRPVSMEPGLSSSISLRQCQQLPGRLVRAYIGCPKAAVIRIGCLILFAIIQNSMYS